MCKKDVPEHIKYSAASLAVILHELGYGDKIPVVKERADKFSKTLIASDAATALGADLDGWSVAVGMYAALGMCAECAGAADLAKQVQKAADN